MLSGGSGRRGTFVALADEPPLHARSPEPPIIAAPPASPAARRNWRRSIELIGRDCIQRPAGAGAREAQRGRSSGRAGKTRTAGALRPGGEEEPAGATPPAPDSPRAGR